jgi:Leucine-rich repeat (LRR) protein
MGNACAASRRRLLNNGTDNQQQSDANNNEQHHDNGNGNGNDDSNNGNGEGETIWLAHRSLKSMPLDIPTSVTSLVMDFNQLTDLNGQLLQRCSKLTDLSVAANQLDLLPLELWRMRQLTSLNIGGNIVRQIPADIRGLQTLKSLQAQANLLKQLPLTLERLPLQLLNVAQNSIIHLPNDTAMVYLRFTCRHDFINFNCDDNKIVTISNLIIKSEYSIESFSDRITTMFS